jgi:hypothetical protein
MGWIKKLFGMEKPKEEAEEETRKELVYLSGAKKAFNWGWGILGEQLKYESRANSPQQLHSTAAIGTHFKDALPKFEEALALVKATRKEDKRVKKIIHAFFSLISSESKQIEDELTSLLRLFDDLIYKIEDIHDSCKRNKELGEVFHTEWEKKGRYWQNYNPTSLLRKFKTPKLNKDAETASAEIDRLIERIERILNLEEHLPEVKRKPGRGLAIRR